MTQYERDRPSQCSQVQQMNDGLAGRKQFSVSILCSIAVPGSSGCHVSARLANSARNFSFGAGKVRVVSGGPACSCWLMLEQQNWALKS